MCSQFVLILASDTLILWQDPDGKDYALSFQDLKGCSEAWDFIQEVRKHLRSLGSSVLSLLPLTHTNLNHAQMNLGPPHRTQSTPLQVAYTLVSSPRLHWPIFATSNAQDRRSICTETRTNSGKHCFHRARSALRAAAIPSVDFLTHRTLSGNSSSSCVMPRTSSRSPTCMPCAT